MSDFWSSKRVCITGGAGFIGSHLADTLVGMAKEVVVADNFSSGLLENVPEKSTVRLVDLRDYYQCLSAIRDCDIIFHLASDVGGRAYLSNNNYRMWMNLGLDTSVFRACADAKIGKLIYFSSACVYPTKTAKVDGVYGAAKLIGEKVLADMPFQSVSVRPFTVYGERMKENRAICALIAKTFIRQEPFEVWGDGNQPVDWIYVRDVVSGVLLAAEKMDGEVNIGSGVSHTPMDALDVIWNYAGWKPREVVFKTDMPVSPDRVSNSKKLRNFGWSMNYSFERGIQNTIDWYYRSHSRDDVRKNLGRRLVER